MRDVLRKKQIWSNCPWLNRGAVNAITSKDIKENSFNCSLRIQWTNRGHLASKVICQSLKAERISETVLVYLCLPLILARFCPQYVENGWCGLYGFFRSSNSLWSNCLYTGLRSVRGSPEVGRWCAGSPGAGRCCARKLSSRVSMRGEIQAGLRCEGNSSSRALMRGKSSSRAQGCPGQQYCCP